jgi:hypothetical protein
MLQGRLSFWKWRNPFQPVNATLAPGYLEEKGVLVGWNMQTLG